jgi:Chalcone isomerase-like
MSKSARSNLSFASRMTRHIHAALFLMVTSGWLVPGTSSAQESLPSPNAQAASVGTVAVPPELAVYGAGWRAKGTGSLKFFGFKAYDATLWLPGSAGGNFGFVRPFALDITYNTYVKATDINNTSLIEMSRISAASPEQVKAWSGFMTNMFVDVKSGDRLLGVHVPAGGARFFLNGKLLGETSDTAFSEAFFRIWLDPKARKPELRSALLGL